MLESVDKTLHYTEPRVTSFKNADFLRRGWGGGSQAFVTLGLNGAVESVGGVGPGPFPTEESTRVPAG